MNAYPDEPPDLDLGFGVRAWWACGHHGFVREGRWVSC